MDVEFRGKKAARVMWVEEVLPLPLEVSVSCLISALSEKSVFLAVIRIHLATKPVSFVIFVKFFFLFL